MEEGRRKLAAIVFTDMIGYTALAQRNENKALDLLGAQNAILRSILRQHHGREVKTVGDAFLIEFDSALEAVMCTIEIQSMLRERNKNVSSGDEIVLRIGVHMGDVVHRDNDIFGDTVNIASRIQTVAEPGTVCVSEDVYNQIKNKVNYQIEKIPSQRLKNVEAEMNIYEIKLPWETQNSQAPFPGSLKSRIAVIPFANISPNPDDRFFTDGLTEELIATLSEISGLRVIARSSVMKYKGIDRTASAIGRELSVPYILEGSVRKLGDKIRVNVQLIDCETEEPKWSSRYERKIEDLFAIQSDIAKSVADSLKVTLQHGDKVRIEKKDTDNLLAYAAYLKGRAYLHERTESAIRAAREQFLLAVKEDPSYARAYAGLADSHMLLGDYLFDPVPQSLDMAKVYIDKALALDPDIAEARVSLANYLVYDYQFFDAEIEFKRSIQLNPSYATGHHWYSNLLEDLGRPDESLAEILLAEQLDPLSSPITITAIYACIRAGKVDEGFKRVTKLLAIDANKDYVDEAYMTLHFAAREWDDALVYLQRMNERDPKDPPVLADIAYIEAVRGNRKEALRTIEYLKTIPHSSRLRCGLIAFVYHGLGDLQECFNWLDKAVREREMILGWFRTYPLFDEVRKDPRFNLVLKRANLPPESLQRAIA